MTDPGRDHAGIPGRPLLAPWARLAVDGGRVAVRIDDAAVVLEGPAADEARWWLARGAEDRKDVPAAAHAALAERRIAVVGEGACAALVAALLAAAGPTVQRLDLEAAAADPRLDLVVVAPAGGRATAFADADAALRGRAGAWLPVPGLDGPRAVVGPIIVPGASCCWQCYRLRRAGASGFGDAWAALDAAPGPQLAGAAAALVAAFAAQVALCAVVDAVGVAVPAGVAWAIELAPEVAVTRHVVHRVPRCPACSRAAALPELLPWLGEGAA